MPRTHYRNGDPITLLCGCDGCRPSRINGVLCHETACPDAWRDYAVECFECGRSIYPETREESLAGRHFVCADCRNEDCDDGGWSAMEALECDDSAQETVSENDFWHDEVILTEEEIEAENRATDAADRASSSKYGF